MLQVFNGGPVPPADFCSGHLQSLRSTGFLSCANTFPLLSISFVTTNFDYMELRVTTNSVVKGVQHF